MTTQLTRIPLAYPIGTRSGSDLSKDPYIRNGMIEQYGNTFRVVKRPGIHTQSDQPAPSTSAQGLTYYNGHYFLVVGDVLYRTSGADPISADGIAWTQAPTPLWYARSFFTATVFQNRIYVIGGEAAELRADISYTADGVGWATNAGGAPFGHRQGHQCVVFNNQMWLIGGLENDSSIVSLMNDVWSSPDGVTWTQVTAAAEWTPRDNHTVVVGTNGMYLYGGDTGGGVGNDDVWFSSDGKTWTNLTLAATGTGRLVHNMFYFNSMLWIVGGSTGATALNDVWSSPDGQTWTQQTASAFASGRYDMAGTIYQDKMWLIGGVMSLTLDANVYSSSDGITWNLITTGPGFTNRGGCQAVTFQTPTSVNQYQYDTIWLLGGNTGGGNELQEVWYANLDVNSPVTYTLNPDVSGQGYEFTTYTNGTKLIVKNQSNLWVLAGGVLTKVTDPNYPTETVPGVVELNAFLHVMTPHGEIHSCEIDDPLTWPSLNFVTADYEDDDGVAIAKHLNFVVAFGTITFQLFYDNGANQPVGSPLAPYQVANTRIGCAAAFSVMCCANMLYWVASTTNNARSVMRLNGITPEVVSTFYVDRIIGPNSGTNPTALETLAFELGTNDGRPLYVLAPFGITEYLVFDPKYNEWYEWTFGVPSDVPLFFATSSAVGDYTCLGQFGKLITVSQQYLDDDGTPFAMSVQTLKNDYGNMARKFWGRVSLVADMQSNTNVTIEASDNDYQSFTSFGTVDCSLARPQITRLGSSRRRAWRITQTDSNPSVRPEALEIEYSQGES